MKKKVLIGASFLAFIAIFVNFVGRGWEGMTARGAETPAESMTSKETEAQHNDKDMENTDGVLVEFKTTMGDITVKLYNDTPLHRDNFLKLVKDGYYDGLLFHRVIDQFMIQTGDPDSKDAPQGKMLGSGGPSYTIEAEIDYPKHYNKYGALAAARTGDQFNPERRSSGSQFYIVTGRKMTETQFENMQMGMHQQALEQTFRRLVAEHRDTIESLQKSGDREALEALRQELIKKTEAQVDTTVIPENIKNDYITKGGAPHLDGAYTVFGEVVEGMDVVEKIQKVETDDHDRPKEDVKIISAKILQ